MRKVPIAEFQSKRRVAVFFGDCFGFPFLQRGYESSLQFNTCHHVMSLQQQLYVRHNFCITYMYMLRIYPILYVRGFLACYPILYSVLGK